MAYGPPSAGGGNRPLARTTSGYSMHWTPGAYKGQQRQAVSVLNKSKSR